MPSIELISGSSRRLGDLTVSDIRLAFDVTFLRKYLRLFKGAKFAVFCTIAQHADVKTGWSKPSIAVIALESGYSDPNTIGKAINELEELTIEGCRVMLAIQRRTSTGLFVRKEFLVLPTKREVIDYELGLYGELPPVQPYREKPSTEGEPHRGLRYTVNHKQSISESSDHLESVNDLESKTTVSKLGAESASEHQLAYNAVRDLIAMLQTTGLDLMRGDARNLVISVIAVCSFGMSKGDTKVSILTNSIIKDQLPPEPSILQLANFAVELWDMYQWWPTANKDKETGEPLQTPARKDSITRALRSYRNRPKPTKPTSTPQSEELVEWGITKEGVTRPLQAGELPSKFTRTWFAPRGGK